VDSHRQVFIKTNAAVDEGIADLISALSEFPTLCTLSSCEGGAFVTFRFGRTLEEQARFLCWLSLQTIGLGTLTAEWGGGNSLVFTLRCPSHLVTSLAAKVAELSKAGRSAKPCDNQRIGSSSSLPSPCLLAQLASYDELASLHDQMLRDLNI
jgi:hypothetical protein